MLKYLNIKDIMSLNLTCKHFYNILNSDLTSNNSIWFRLLQRDFKSKFDNEMNLGAQQASSIDYKNLYIKFYPRKTEKYFRYKHKYLFF